MIERLPAASRIGIASSDKGAELMSDERITESEARLQTFMQYSPSPMFIKDLHGRYVHVNAQFLRAFGFRLEEVLSHSDDEIVSANDAARFKATDALVLSEGKAIEYESVGHFTDGPHTTLVCKFPLRDNTGHITALGGIVTDIEERIAAVRALRASEAKLMQALEDRERVARDLHDGIMQEIYAIGLGLEEAQRSADLPPGALRVRLGITIDRLNKVLRDVRGHITGRAPAQMSGAQLHDEFVALIATLKGMHPLRIDLDADPAAIAALQSTSTHDLLLIAREAISNTLRHARARTARISLRHEGGAVALRIEDDGIGFNIEAPLTRGNGLRNIALRARHLGARISVRSNPGHGTAIGIEIPVGVAHDSPSPGAVAQAG
jgi:PAS domain S-box-containing protein